MNNTNNIELQAALTGGEKYYRVRPEISLAPLQSIEQIINHAPDSERFFRVADALKDAHIDLPRDLGRDLGHENGSSYPKIVAMDKSWNIDLGHTYFYETDARSYCFDQVKAFLDNPKRYDVVYLNTSPLKHISTMRMLNSVQELINGANKYHKDTSMEFSSQMPSDQNEAEFLIIYGAGLGLHIPALLNSLKVRRIKLVETEPRLLSTTMQMIDLFAVHEELQRRDGGLEIYCDHEPLTLIESLKRSFTNQYSSYDGTYVFRHYRSAQLDAVADDIERHFAGLSHPRGFFEDEVVMLRNVARNLSIDLTATTETLPPRFFDEECVVHNPQRGATFVVGAGPSLDASLPAIKKNQDRAVIISAGTALGALLAADITPDYHVELENTPQQYDILLQTKKRYSLDNIVFLAATCVDPRLPPLFSHTVFFMRDQLAPAIVFNNYPVTRMVAPSVSNAALRLAINMGNRLIVLAGIDLGTREQHQHHARGTLYHSMEILQDEAHRKASEFRIESRGNFGGVVYTNTVFLLAQEHINMVAGAYTQSGGCIVNCSDGVYLDDTVACIPDLLTTVIKQRTHPQWNRQMAVNAFEDTLHPINGLLHDPIDYNALFQSIGRRCDDICVAVEQEIQQLNTDWQQWDAARVYLFAMLKERGRDPMVSRMVEQLYSGVLASTFAFVIPVLKRLPSADARIHFVHGQKEVIRAVWRDMSDQTQSLWSSLLETLRSGNTTDYPDNTPTTTTPTATTGHTANTTTLNIHHHNRKE